MTVAATAKRRRRQFALDKRWRPKSIEAMIRREAGRKSKIDQMMARKGKR